MTGPGGFELAIVAILRNEAPYVEEWIAYHSVVGVEHFYLYDNGSDDDIRAVLRRYIAHGLVTMIEFPIGGGQVPAYAHAVHCFGGSSRWLAPIDLDEFIVPTVDADIPALLRRLGEVDRVVLPWRNFGMSGHRTAPPGLVIENFTMAEDIPEGGFERKAIKSIARPDAIVSVNVHTQAVSSDRTLDADGNQVEMDTVHVLRPSYRSAQLNHYATKSEAEFVNKHARGEANRNLPRRLYTVEEERGFDTADHSIEPFVEPTRQRLEEHRSLSPTPFRYGSHVQLRIPHPDLYVHHVTLAVSNYLHGMRITRNAAKLIVNLMAGERRALVAPVVDRHRGPGAGRFSDSSHFVDLVRRLEADVMWQAGATTKVFESIHLVAELDASPERRHLTWVAVVECDEPTTLRWSTRGEPPTDGVATVLPGPGRYVCVIEANHALTWCGAAVVEVVEGGPVAFDELFVLGYG